MHGHTATQPAPNVTEDRAAPWTLESLARLSSGALEVIFAAGSSDADLSRLSGHPHGRVLAVPALRARPLAFAVRWLASTPLILWEGKSFQAAPGASRGRGANRATLGGRAALFPFRTTSEASVVDGAPCIAISYDVPRNPRVMRPIYDELRLVAPDLYLGRGTYRRPGHAARLLMWFALDAAQQDGPLALPVPRD